MNKKILLLTVLIINSCTSTVVTNTPTNISQSPSALSTPINVTPTPSNTLNINEELKKLASELSLALTGEYVLGANIDDNNDIVLTTRNNNLYKITNLKNFKTYLSDFKDTSPYRSNMKTDNILLDKSGKGLIVREREHETRHCPSMVDYPCIYPGPDLYKVDNYLIKNNFIRTYEGDTNNSKKSFPKLTITDPQSGEGYLTYIDYENNKLIVSKLKNFSDYLPETILDIEQGIKFTNIQNTRREQIIRAFNDKTKTEYYYILNKSGELSLLLSFQSNSPRFVPIINLEIDNTGNGYLYDADFEESKLKKIYVYNVSSYKANNDSKKEIIIPLSIDISVIQNLYNYNSPILDKDGNGAVIFFSGSDNSKNLNILRIKSYQPEDKALELKQYNKYAINKSGNGIVISQNNEVKIIKDFNVIE